MTAIVIVTVTVSVKGSKFKTNKTTQINSDKCIHFRDTGVFSFYLTGQEGVRVKTMFKSNNNFSSKKSRLISRSPKHVEVAGSTIDYLFGTTHKILDPSVIYKGKN